MSVEKQDIEITAEKNRFHQKKVWQKLLWIATGFLVLIIIVGLCVCYILPLQILPHDDLRVQGYPKENALLTKEQVQEDAKQMVDFLEEVHPAFLQKPTEKYLDAKNTYLAEANRKMEVSDFSVITNRYLSSLNDGHTHIFPNNVRLLSVHWEYKNGSLIVGSGCDLPENAKVVSIGGISTSDILKQVSSQFPAENEAAQANNYECFSRYRSVLSSAGVPDGGSVEIAAESNGTLITKPIGFQKPSGDSGDSKSIESRQQNGAFVVTMTSCEVDKDLDDTVQKLKNALNNGTRKVIIDVRGNGGGSSTACENLLRAMSMSYGEYGSTTRYSTPASQQRGYLRRSGSYTVVRNNTSVKNNKVHLYVLTDAGTFSSATMLGVWVQDGHLGKVVGQPSANAPSCYGDIIEFQLNNSKLFGSVSHKIWLRPDASANQNELVPDVPVPDGQDALETALYKLP